MKDEILSNRDNSGQLEKVYRADKPTFKRHVKLCIPNSNTTYHTTDIGREAFKSHLDALELILSIRKDN